jgi:hypothetical protein
MVAYFDPASDEKAATADVPINVPWSIADPSRKRDQTETGETFSQQLLLRLRFNHSRIAGDLVTHTITG